MRYETQTVRIGERVGDIDWSYDFLRHFDLYCTNDATKAEFCEAAKAMLKTIETRFREGKKTLTTSDGGWPRVGFGKVLDVGMYDGWPYWKPVPAVLVSGPVGAEWKTFSMLTEIQEIDK